jgi:hypothetical protein
MEIGAAENLKDTLASAIADGGALFRCCLVHPFKLD